MRVLATAITAIAIGLPAIAASQDVVRVENGQTRQIDRHGTCRQVTNHNGNPVAVPTRIAQEWSVGGNSFLNNIAGMPGVSVSNCAPAHPPVPANANVTVYWPNNDNEGCYMGAGEWRTYPPGWARPIEHQGNSDYNVPIDGACLLTNGGSMRDEALAGMPSYITYNNGVYGINAGKLAYPGQNKTCYVFLATDGYCSIHLLVSERRLSGLASGR